MILFNVKIEIVISWEVFAALGASVDMSLAVMNLIIFVASKRQCLVVGRQRAVHDFRDRR